MYCPVYNPSSHTCQGMSYRKFCQLDIERPDGSSKDRTTAITGFIISEGRALFTRSGVRYSQSRSGSCLYTHIYTYVHTPCQCMPLSIHKRGVDVETRAQGHAHRKAKTQTHTQNTIRMHGDTVYAYRHSLGQRKLRLLSRRTNLSRLYFY